MGRTPLKVLNSSVDPVAPMADKPKTPYEVGLRVRYITVTAQMMAPFVYAATDLPDLLPRTDILVMILPDSPATAGAVGAPSREQPQAVAQELACPADHPHGQRARPEKSQVLADDAARSLVGEIGEEAHHADHDHEPQGRRPP